MLQRIWYADSFILGLTCYCKPKWQGENRPKVWIQVFYFNAFTFRSISSLNFAYDKHSSTLRKPFFKDKIRQDKIKRRSYDNNETSIVSALQAYLDKQTKKKRNRNKNKT
jgi:hypothetical protein